MIEINHIILLPIDLLEIWLENIIDVIINYVYTMRYRLENNNSDIA